MDFSRALEVVKSGKGISREGWNGKGMFVVYQKAYPEGIPCNKQTAESWGMSEGDLFKCEPYLQIRMVNGSHSMWVPSINDILASDWSEVDPRELGRKLSKELTEKHSHLLKDIDLSESQSVISKTISEAKNNMKVDSIKSAVSSAIDEIGDKLELNGCISSSDFWKIMGSINSIVKS